MGLLGTPVSFSTFRVVETGVYTQQPKVGSAAINVSLPYDYWEFLASLFSSEGEGQKVFENPHFDYPCLGNVIEFVGLGSRRAHEAKGQG